MSVLPILDPTIVGCASPNGYQITKREAVGRHAALKGRPRYRLRDTFAYYTLNVTLDLTNSEFESFQTFWVYSTRSGADPFYMSLMLDDPAIYRSGTEVYPVHALAPWTASSGFNDQWTVTLQVEVPSGIVFGLLDCPAIYGGPLTALAPDQIYPGTPGMLAPDIIEPCPYVLSPQAGA